MIAYRTTQLLKTDALFESLGWALLVGLSVAVVQLFNAVWFQVAWVYLAALLALVLVTFSMFPRLLGEIWNVRAET